MFAVGGGTTIRGGVGKREEYSSPRRVAAWAAMARRVDVARYARGTEETDVILYCVVRVVVLISSSERFEVMGHISVDKATETVPEDERRQLRAEATASLLLHSHSPSSFTSALLPRHHTPAATSVALLHKVFT